MECCEQLGANPLRVGVGLVDLVDRHDQRHAGRLRVVDRLDGLRHDAVIGRHHQHDDIRHLGAAGAHGREGRVAGRIDEGDLAAERRGHLIGADMLRDAAGFAGDHVGLADRVEQRGLAVVDVAHDGHDRRTGDEVLVHVRRVEQAFLDVRFRDALHRVAELLRDELRGIGIDHVGDLVHLALLHQELDHVHGALRHAVGELLDGDRLRNRHLAGDLFLLLHLAVAHETLIAAAEGGERAGALVLARGRVGQGQTAAALFLAGSGLGRLRQGRGLGRDAGTTDGACTLLVVRHDGAGCDGGSRADIGLCRFRIGRDRRGRARHMVQARRTAAHGAATTALDRHSRPDGDRPSEVR